MIEKPETVSARIQSPVTTQEPGSADQRSGLRATRQRTTNEQNDEVGTRIGETASLDSRQHAATDREDQSR